MLSSHAGEDAAEVSVLAVDFGGSHISCGLVSRRVVVAERTLAVTGETLAAMLPALTQALRQCAAETPGASPLRGIAIGFCGLMHGGGNRVSAVFGKYEDALGFNWDQWAETEFGLPLRMRNDAQLALLGEVWAGAAQNARDVVMITLGTGIGGAAMLDGHLLASRSGHAGSLGGHLAVRADGRRCTCGGLGCAEAEASTAVLAEICREHPGFLSSALARESRLDFEALFHAHDAGDPVAGDVLRHCIGIWSSLTVSLIHAYGPEMVLFGGGLMRRAEDILPPIREHVHTYACRTSTGLPRIEPARLGDRAVLLGGEALFAAELPSRSD